MESHTGSKKQTERVEEISESQRMMVAHKTPLTKNFVLKWAAPMDRKIMRWGMLTMKNSRREHSQL